jgi:hypothetical protein
MKRIAVLLLAFTIRTSGQTPSTYTDHPNGDSSLLPTVQSKLPDALLGVVIEGWHYDPGQKILILHLVNHSHKVVTAFNISMAVKYADGSTNPWYAEGIPHNLQDSQKMEDELNLFIQSQEGRRGGRSFAVVGGPVINGQIQIQGPPTSVFAAGTTRDYVMRGEEKEVADIEAVVDVVAYADGTADVLNNDRAFRNLMAERKGRLLAMEKVTDVIKRVLADPMASDPVSTALNELLPFAESLDAKTKNRSPEVAENNVARNLQGDIQNLQRMQQEKMSGSAQRESLERYVEYYEKLIALMKPHCELERTQAK